MMARKRASLDREKARRRAALALRYGMALFLIAYVGVWAFEWFAPSPTYLAGRALVGALCAGIDAISFCILLWPAAFVSRAWGTRAMLAGVLLLGVCTALTLENAMLSAALRAGLVSEPAGIWGWMMRLNAVTLYLAGLSVLGAIGLALLFPLALRLCREPGVRWFGRVVLAAIIITGMSELANAAVMIRFSSGVGYSPGEWWPMALNTFGNWIAWPAFGLWIVMYLGAIWHAKALVRGPHREGWCDACAYDLRGITPGAPCPECGQATRPTPS